MDVIIFVYTRRICVPNFSKIKGGQVKVGVEQFCNYPIVFSEITVFINEEKGNMTKRQIKSKPTKKENEFSEYSHLKVFKN